jgi:hypothetical protein
MAHQAIRPGTTPRQVDHISACVISDGFRSYLSARWWQIADRIPKIAENGSASVGTVIAIISES